MSSSCIASISYDKETQTLYVSFVKGSINYALHGVPPKVAEAFQNAGSQGQFWNTQLRGKY